MTEQQTPTKLGPCQCPDCLMHRAASVMLATLRKVRDSFIYVDDHSDTAVMSEADNHAFDEICAAINLAEGRNEGASPHKETGATDERVG